MSLTATQRRANFAFLTSKQRRVAIAEDAKEQVLARRTQVKSRARYIAARNAQSLADIGAKLDNRSADPTEEEDDLAPYCSVCALGSLFMSSAKLFDNLPLTRLRPYVAEILAEEPNETQHYFNLFQRDEIVKALEDAFGERTLMMIESAFERRVVWGESVRIEDPLAMEELRQEANKVAWAFKKYETDDERFIAICDNIIEHGDFVMPTAMALAAELTAIAYV